jgi:hypothetical protein
MGCVFCFSSNTAWQFAPKKGIDNFRANLYLGFRRRLKGLAKLNFCRSEVGWVISSEGQPDEQPDLKKPTALRGAVGVWDRESGDRIKGCDGACVHAIGFLAGADG